jgi:hypothetical protein
MLKELLNPSQSANNALKLYRDESGCCGDTLPDCQYSVTIPTANAVNNIIITKAGANKTLTFSPAVTGAANVVAALKTALAAEGYDENDQQPFGVTSETSGTNTIYHLTGDLVVVSMLHNTSTTVNAVKKCSRISKCKYFYAWPGDAGNTTVTINGVAATLATQTLAGNTAAQVQAAIIALANWPSTATIHVVETAAAFEITINDVFTSTYAFGANAFAESNCKAGYKA